MGCFTVYFGCCPLFFISSAYSQPNLNDLFKSNVKVDASQKIGRLELWRHSFGQGGINPIPLPTRAIGGIRKLRPRLIRIFIQEYFNIYKENGTFNWQILDPYIDALAQTGAKIVACLTIKPKRLFPQIDQRIWRPKDVEEWQKVIHQLVKRCSVEKPIVTYWEVANEPDIGEAGGTPFLIQDPKEYCEFYKITIEPILKACPTAKVGGPALASVNSPLLEGLVNFCRETGTKLDFVSWHLYSDDPDLHAQGVEKAKTLLEDFPGKKPEILITEWNRNISDVSGGVRDASIVSACLISMVEVGVDWTFYYQIWDQVFYKDYFEKWFSPKGVEDMVNFWNPPPPFGLFDLNEEVRAPYFVYQMLYRMGQDRLPVICDDPDVKILASSSNSKVALFLTNVSPQGKAINLRIVGLKPGVKIWRIYSLDERENWSLENLELLPVWERRVTTSTEFTCQFYAPSYSVIQALLEEVK